MEDSNEFDDEMKRVEKLLSNKKIKDKVDEYLGKIQELLDCDVDLTFPYTDPYEKEYMEILTGYELDEEFDKQETMNVDTFMNFFNDEELDLKMTIDPIYLHEGLNNIVDCIITTLDDRLILVPITKI